MNRTMSLLLVSVGFAILLSGCGSGVSKPAPDDGTPTELLTGSWYAMETVIDANGNEETDKIVLTLTPERYIYHAVRYGRDGEVNDGERFWFSGEWRADETTITTTTVPWNRDERSYGDPQSAQKSYYFSDDKDALYVHRWLPDDARHYERFTGHPELGDISGTYLFERHYTRDDQAWQDWWTYTISNDSFAEQRYVEIDGEPWINWRIEGDLRYDRANYYMLVSVTQADGSVGGVPETGLDRQFVGQTLRYAYAPTAASDHIAISRMWEELSYDRDSYTWSDREDNPYGNYWVFAKRQ